MHSLKANLPIDLTEKGIIISFNSSKLLKDPSLIETNDAEIIKFINEVQSSK